MSKVVFVGVYTIAKKTVSSLTTVKVDIMKEADNSVSSINVVAGDPFLNLREGPQRYDIHMIYLQGNKEIKIAKFKLLDLPLEVDVKKKVSICFDSIEREENQWFIKYQNTGNTYLQFPCDLSNMSDFAFGFIQDYCYADGRRSYNVKMFINGRNLTGFEIENGLR